MVKVPIMTEIEMPTFDENDRTDLVISVGEFYGRDGMYPRTDLGRWLVIIDDYIFNIFLESNGRLEAQTHNNTEKLIWDAMKPEIEKEAHSIYHDLMNNKYQPLFKKYGLKGFNDVIDLCMNQKGLKEWVNARWEKDKVILWTDNGRLHVQIGNLGMYIHIWEDGDKFCCYVNYYLDFPGDKFRPNNYGSQTQKDIKIYGYKIFMKPKYCFGSESKRFDKMEELYEGFASGKIVQ